jgi:hypothetical protein
LAMFEDLWPGLLLLEGCMLLCVKDISRCRLRAQNFLLQGNK